uniref:Uncharacterized protein n=1 Tax=Plectus sambesii TaxID=2011161 RepID=A0A914USF9_9BILA
MGAATARVDRHRSYVVAEAIRLRTEGIGPYALDEGCGSANGARTSSSDRRMAAVVLPADPFIMVRGGSAGRLRSRAAAPSDAAACPRPPTTRIYAGRRAFAICVQSAGLRTAVPRPTELIGLDDTACSSLARRDRERWWARRGVPLAHLPPDSAGDGAVVAPSAFSRAA